MNIKKMLTDAGSFLISRIIGLFMIILVIGLIHSCGNEAHYAMYGEAAEGSVKELTMVYSPEVDLDFRTIWLGETALLSAIKHDNMPAVRFLLENGADPDKADWLGETPLMAAAKLGRLGMMRLLVDKGADPAPRAWFSGHTALSRAIRNKQQSIIAYMIDACVGESRESDVFLNTLVKLVSDRQFADADLIFARGFDVNCRDTDGKTVLMHLFSMKDDTAGASYLAGKGARLDVRDREGKTPLHVAAGEGNSTLVDFALAKGADIGATDRDGNTAVLWAARNEHTGMLRHLIAKGGDINAVDNNGWSALMFACSQDNKKMVRFLLESGCRVNYHSVKSSHELLNKAALMSPFLFSMLTDFDVICDFDNTKCLYKITVTRDDEQRKYTLKIPHSYLTQRYIGITPLMIASQLGYTGIAQELIKHGAAINSTDQDGMSALMFACAQGKKRIVKELLENAADPQLRTRIGADAMLFAVYHGRLGCVTLLHEYGAELESIDTFGNSTLSFLKGNSESNLYTYFVEQGVDPGIFTPSESVRENPEKARYDAVLRQIVEDMKAMAPDQDGRRHVMD
ncbi:ankyrin repeat domain-containing protein [bacterium]|nr:ankyrin repeat domain-containing protein [bacterium]